MFNVMAFLLRNGPSAPGDGCTLESVDKGVGFVAFLMHFNQSHIKNIDSKRNQASWS